MLTETQQEAKNFYKKIFVRLSISFFVLSGIEFYLDLYISNESSIWLLLLVKTVLVYVVLMFLGYLVIYKHFQHFFMEQHGLKDQIKTQVLQIKKQQEELASQSKFAAMGEMISMIAHQWRQPLNVIVLHLNSLKMMIETKKVKKEELDNIIENITESVEYMSKTIDDFRDFLKKEDKAENVNIGDLIYKPKHLIEAEFEKLHINFEVNSDIELDTTLLIDKSKFHQVILNLFKNSVDEFKSKNIENPFINVNIFKHETYLRFEISDNAGGIDDKVIKNLFEPYVSTKGKNGTGIGLYMSKRIIKEYIGGNISVENIDKGAVFIIDIPIKQDEECIFDKEHKCFKWNKDEASFIRCKRCSHEEALLESREIIHLLNTFFIYHEITDNQDIKIHFFKEYELMD